MRPSPTRGRSNLNSTNSHIPRRGRWGLYFSLSRPAGEGRGEGGGLESPSPADQDGAEVVDVGERRASDDAVA